MRISAGFLYLIAIALFAFAVSGCETPYQRERVLRSVYVEGGVMDGNEDRQGKRSWDSDGSYIAIGFHPFAGVGGPDRVIVEATHAAADVAPACGEPGK